MAVDMSAALLIMSAGEARRRGVPAHKWIFLHGCSEANDRIELLERPSLCRSPAIRFAGEAAFRMAGVHDANKDLDFLDIYSCFPVAVQVACKELGVAWDSKKLTVTGGLPYHGGPGSNYVTHSIAAMADKLRGVATQARGLVTANGGYLTKHAFGVYANFPDTAACRGTWHRGDPEACQAVVDAQPKEEVAQVAHGKGTVESYCVRFGRQGPELGIVVGKLLDGPDAQRRYVANVLPTDDNTMRQLLEGDPIGATGHVSFSKNKSFFSMQPSAARL